MSDLDRLLAKENEIARLMGALLRIANIKNELDGDDWSEIERARQIARAALTTQCACGEREECDHSCMPDVIDGVCSHCGERVPGLPILPTGMTNELFYKEQAEYWRQIASQNQIPTPAQTVVVSHEAVEAGAQALADMVWNPPQPLSSLGYRATEFRHQAHAVLKAALAAQPPAAPVGTHDSRCDCQQPEEIDGVRLISNSCRVHNENPDPCHDCGTREPCDEGCPNHVEPPAASVGTAPKCGGVICEASSQDGVICADDSCDYQTGVRSPPRFSADNEGAATLWQIEEYKFWKGYGTTEWRPINIISRVYSEMHEMVLYIQRNNPDRVLRVVPDGAVLNEPQTVSKPPCACLRPGGDPLGTCEECSPPPQTSAVEALDWLINCIECEVNVPRTTTVFQLRLAQAKEALALSRPNGNCGGAS